MSGINTRYGTIEGFSYISYYEDGSIKDCKLNSLNELKTPFGVLVPQYEDAEERRKHIVSLSFHNNGVLKSISLQNQVLIETSIGTLPAEYITFYENGNIDRLFPLNGKLTAYWTEEEEYDLAEYVNFNSSIGKFDKKIISVHFYEDNTLKSITFWSKDTVSIQTAVGHIETRIGISFYEDGKLKSLEPNEPVTVKTKIGNIYAYNSQAIGIHGDSNSLRFSSSGEVEALITSTDTIEVVDGLGNKQVFSPKFRKSIVDDENFEIVPLSIEFSNDKVIFNNGIEHEYNIQKYSFNIKTLKSLMNRAANTACSSCSECSGCA